MFNHRHSVLQEIEDVSGAGGFADRAALRNGDLSRKPSLKIGNFEGKFSLQAAVSPDSSYLLVKSALQAARQNVLLYIYNVTAAHLVDLLEEARDRGVQIEIMFDRNDTQGDEIRILNNLGVTLHIAPSFGDRRVFTVCHQKYAVIDGSIVLLGSANWAGTGIPKRESGAPFRKGNREWLVRVDDADLAQFFRKLFEADRDIPAIRAEAAAAAIPLFSPLTTVSDIPSEEFAVKKFNRTTVDITPLICPDNYLQQTLKLIKSARSRVWVQQQYIKGGDSAPSIEALLAAVLKRKQKGKDVRFLVSPAFRKQNAVDSWEQSVETLKNAGLGDCLKAQNLDYFTHCHNKGVIVDNSVIVSSTNWSENSVARAREAGLLIRSRSVTKYYADVFDFDWTEGIPADDVDKALPSDFVPRALTPALEVHHSDFPPELQEP